MSVGAINGKMKEFDGHYDRSLVALAVGIGMIFMFYLKMGDIVDRMVERSPAVQNLKSRGAKQEADNAALMREISEVKEDVKKILWSVRRTR